MVEPETLLETAFALVICPLKRAIPPGFPVVSPAECQCSPGFGYDAATETCEPCAIGTYKAGSSLKCIESKRLAPGSRR